MRYLSPSHSLSRAIFRSNGWSGGSWMGTSGCVFIFVSLGGGVGRYSRSDLTSVCSLFVGHDRVALVSGIWGSRHIQFTRGFADPPKPPTRTPQTTEKVSKRFRGPAKPPKRFQKGFADPRNHRKGFKKVSKRFQKGFAAPPRHLRPGAAYPACSTRGNRSPKPFRNLFETFLKPFPLFPRN